MGGADKQYDLVFDEEEEAQQIEFVKQEMIAAMNTDELPPAPEADAEAAAAASAHLSEWEQIQVQRKKLPIYPMKEELMAAIAKYQVLIVVAETGSGSVHSCSRQLVALAPRFFLSCLAVLLAPRCFFLLCTLCCALCRRRVC